MVAKAKDEEKVEVVDRSNDMEYLEEEIFPDGPTGRQVEEWKSRFGEIYSTTFDNEVFIWRTINRIEYKETLKIKGADHLYREERMCSRCVLWPIQYDHVLMASGKAGIPSVLADHIMEKSGFAPTSDVQKL